MLITTLVVMLGARAGRVWAWTAGAGPPPRLVAGASAAGLRDVQQVVRPLATGMAAITLRIPVSITETVLERPSAV